MQTWNLSKNLHRRIFRLKILHRQFHLISTVLVGKNTNHEWKWRNLHRWQKFYTPTGSDVRDKSHLWSRFSLLSLHLYFWASCHHLQQPDWLNCMWKRGPRALVGSLYMGWPRSVPAVGPLGITFIRAWNIFHCFTLKKTRVWWHSVTGIGAWTLRSLLVDKKKRVFSKDFFLTYGTFAFQRKTLQHLSWKIARSYSKDGSKSKKEKANAPVHGGFKGARAHFEQKLRWCLCVMCMRHLLIYCDRYMRR